MNLKVLIISTFSINLFANLMFNGDIELKRDNKLIKVKKETKLKDGDELNVKDVSYMQVIFSPNFILRLKDNSKIKILNLKEDDFLIEIKDGFFDTNFKYNSKKLNLFFKDMNITTINSHLFGNATNEIIFCYDGEANVSLKGKFKTIRKDEQIYISGENVIYENFSVDEFKNFLNNFNQKGVLVTKYETSHQFNKLTDMHKQNKIDNIQNFSQPLNSSTNELEDVTSDISTSTDINLNIPTSEAVNENTTTSILPSVDTSIDIDISDIFSYNPTQVETINSKDKYLNYPSIEEYDKEKIKIMHDKEIIALKTDDEPAVPNDSLKEEIKGIDVQKYYIEGENDYLSWGYWRENSTSTIDKFWFYGEETQLDTIKNFKIDKKIFKYYGGVTGIVQDFSDNKNFYEEKIESGNFRLKFEFGANHIEGNVNFKSEKTNWNIDIDGNGIGGNDFEISGDDFKDEIDMDKMNSQIKGTFFGKEAEAIGAHFNFKKSSIEQKAIGVLHGTKY